VSESESRDGRIERCDFPLHKPYPVLAWLTECDFIFKVKKYVDDPLNWHGGLKAKWANAMLTAMDKIQRESSTIKVPYFLACGGADHVVKNDSSKYLDKHTQSKDQTFKVRLNSLDYKCSQHLSTSIGL